jgi:hypothetical protein
MLHFNGQSIWQMSRCVPVLFVQLPRGLHLKLMRRLCVFTVALTLHCMTGDDWEKGIIYDFSILAYV